MPPSSGTAPGGAGRARAGGDEDHRGSVPTGCDTPSTLNVHGTRPLLLTSAGNAAFYVVFGIFVVAMVMLAVIVIVWAVRHDIAGREAWRRRQEARGPPPTASRTRAVSDAPRLDGGRHRGGPNASARAGRRRRRRPRGRRRAAPARTAFVLAGGGSRGAVQVGMLEELIRRDIRADRVFGASVGAINGASYAGHPTLEDIERMADDLARR